MIANSLQQFCNSVFLFLSGSEKNDEGLIVKKHTDNLKSHGDISFPNTLLSWKCHLKNKRNIHSSKETLLEYIGKEPLNLVAESENWVLHVKKVQDLKGRIYMYLERTHAIRVGLIESVNIIVNLSQRMKDRNCKLLFDQHPETCLTTLRMKYLCQVIENLSSFSYMDSDELVNIFVTSKSSSVSPVGSKVVLCGTVLNLKTGLKESGISSEDYLRIRQNEMTLIAQHKYGVRVSTDSKWKQFIAHLGESAVKFEMLQAKPSSAVKVNFECSTSGSSKGAAFVLYNCARLETIIRTYNEKVTEGLYPELPPIEETDLSLLTHEDEWCLIFNYIMGLPSLLNSCVDMSENSCEFRPHHICNFLSSMVKVFSQYYRRVRILTEPRKHLLPVMFARIHMLRILNDNLKLCLKILNIKSVSQMCF